MPLKKEAVTAVVAEASQKMSDPNYAAVMVGGFVQTQTARQDPRDRRRGRVAGRVAVHTGAGHCRQLPTAIAAPGASGARHGWHDPCSSGGP